jgi:hypothetical protein
MRLHTLQSHRKVRWSWGALGLRSPWSSGHGVHGTMHIWQGVDGLMGARVDPYLYDKRDTNVRLSSSKERILLGCANSYRLYRRYCTYLVQMAPVAFSCQTILVLGNIYLLYGVLVGSWPIWDRTQLLYDSGGCFARVKKRKGISSRTSRVRRSSDAGNGVVAQL